MANNKNTMKMVYDIASLLALHSKQADRGFLYMIPDTSSESFADASMLSILAAIKNRKNMLWTYQTFNLLDHIII